MLGKDLLRYLHVFPKDSLCMTNKEYLESGKKEILDQRSQGKVIKVNPVLLCVFHNVELNMQHATSALIIKYKCLILLF